MPCKPKCHETAALDEPGGHKLMVSVGNPKYPAGTVHSQCKDCLEEQIEWTKLMVLFGNNEAMVEKYLKLKNKKGG